MSEDLNEIFELLRREKFTIINDFDDYFKCTICKEILINAHQALCGCNFCEVCINNYNINGPLNCPGNSTECKSVDLSNISVNDRLNKQISFLKVRCPYSICSYESELNKMENHMRFCTRKNANCPFFNVGCESRETNYDKLNEHMLLEIVNHNKILIDIIGNLRNEVRELSDKEERNRNEIEILKKKDEEKNETIRSLKQEIKKKDEVKNETVRSLKEEIRNLNRNYVDDQIEYYYRNFLTEIDRINNAINDYTKIEDVILLNDKMSKRCDDIDNLIKVFHPNKEKINEHELSNKNLENEIIQINKYLNMCDNGELLWSLGKIAYLNEWTWSGYFYDRQYPYRMQLILFNRFEDLQIGLRIGTGKLDEDLIWPCQANMTIMFGESGNYETPFKKKLFIETVDSNPFEYNNYITINGQEYKNSLNSYKNYDLVCKVKFI